MINPQALRQALQARQMKLSPEEAEPIDPAALQGLEGGAPPPDMPMEAQPEPMDQHEMGEMGGEMGMLPPELQLEAEKLRVKEMLKQTRMKEMEQEANVMRQQRMADIEQEANSLFAGKKKSGGY